jgi:hypothetical protein
MFLAKKLNKGAGTPAITTDPQFNYVTMLLHGDGTNGAQNNTFLDSSGNNYTITRNGNPTQGSFSPYGSNWSNAFTASSGSYLSVPYSSAFNLTGDFTVECWINPSELATGTGVGSPLYPRIFSFGTYNAANSIGLEINSNDSGTVNALVVWYNGSQYYSANNIVAVGNWYHCAMVRSGTTIKIYLNGTSVITITGASAAVNTNQALFIASLQSFTSDANACFKGYISNLRVVKGTAVYTSTFTPPTTPLTAITNTTLLTCQSNRYVDNSTTAATITSFGTPSVQRFNPFGTSTAYSTSVIGGSGYFDGSGDWLNYTGGSISTSVDFTFSIWLYHINSLSGNKGIFCSSNSRFGMLSEVGNFYILASTDIATGVKIPVNQWSHLAITRTSNTLRAFLNGTQVGGTASNSQSLSSFRIGSNEGGEIISPCYMSDPRVLIGTGGTTISVPTAPLTAITNTNFLCNFTNGAIFDNAMINDLETVGNAQISTSVKKFGTGSLAFDGNDYLLAPTTPNMNFGSGDFTIEAWVYRTSESGTPSNIFQKGITTSSNFQLNLSINPSNQLFSYYSTDGSSITAIGTTSTTIALTTWTHVAVSRSGSTWRYFINGTLQNTTTASVTLFTGTGLVSVGANPEGNSGFYGYIDDLRVTKGYARYTATFTPPTAAFFDTGPV